MLRNAKNKALFIVPATLAGAIFAANVRGASITNGNSSLTINPTAGSSEIMPLPFISSWVVDGVDQYGGSPAGGEDLFLSVGTGSGFVGLGALTILSSSFSSGVGSVTYEGSGTYASGTYKGSAFGFTMTVTDILTGGNPGSGASAINETVAVTNTLSSTSDSAPLLFNLVDGLNLNVNGTPNNNTLTLSPSSGTNTATQTVPSGAVVNYSATPTPNTFQTIDESTDTSSSSLGPVTGDEGFEAEWNMSIDAGDSEIVSINETLTGGSTAVPLPNSASATLATLAPLGAIGLVRRMRRATV